MANCRKRKIAAVAAIHLLLKRRIRRRARWVNRKSWCRTWIMRRKRKGVFSNLVRELETEDPGMYRSYMRMLPEHFNVILEMVRPHIQRQDTVMRESISGEQRLALTLRFLATGESLHSLSFAYRVGRSTASGIVKDTCTAIYNCMKDTYLKFCNQSSALKDNIGVSHITELVKHIPKIILTRRCVIKVSSEVTKAKGKHELSLTEVTSDNRYMAEFLFANNSLLLYGTARGYLTIQ